MTDAKRLVDAAARERITSDFATNLLVEAGAGSGKTHEMAGRMAAGIASGVYDLEGMAAVTFTRKAAAELRGRFQLALEAARKTAEPDEAARIQPTLSNLERFFAGTIHSFCAHLLHARPVEAGVSPGFTELDEQEDADLRRLAWRDFIVDARAAGDAALVELREAGLKPSDLDGAFDVVCNDEDVVFPAGDRVRPDVEGAWKALETFWARMQKILPAQVSADTTCKTQKACERFRRQFRVSTARRDRPSVLAQLLVIWDFTPGITQMWWADDTATKKRLKQDVEALHGDFRDAVVEPFITAWREYLYRLAVTLLTRARHYASAERRRRNTLNYNDLLLLAARLLRENPDVRRALQQKSRWLFVDEFQDTDPVQAEIMFLLAADEDSGARRYHQRSTVHGQRTEHADWRIMPLRPGALFVVGDPKQSIYRFRRADIEIYNQVRERFESAPNGAVVALTANFRSVPDVCQFGNTVFETMFPAAPTAHSPQFAGLSTARDMSSNPAPPAQGVLTLTVDPALPASDAPTAEAAAIARYIRAEVEARRRTWGDFLILTRKKSRRLLPYVEALEELQIPMEVSGAGAFAESEEVRDVALLLRALGDPEAAVPLVGVLRGRLFGISDQELFDWKQLDGWFSIFADVDATARRGHPVGGALRVLGMWYRWTRVLPIAAAIDRILEDSGYLALAATTPAGVEAGDLLHAVDRVRQVAERGGSLADAADALEADLESIGDVESLPLEPGRTDVVRVMNLHKAKGLEASVVFLADPCPALYRGVNRRIVRDGTGARGWFAIEKSRADGERTFGKPIAQPAGWDVHQAEEQAFLDAENIRLLYVAATRARDVLVVGRHIKDGKGAWAALAPFLSKAPELAVPAKVSAPKPATADVSVDLRRAAADARHARHAGARAASWSLTSVTAEARHIARMTRAAEPAPAADDPTRVVIQDTPSHRADAGMAWGSLIHGLLEHAMRHAEATRDDLRRLAMWLTMEERQLRKVLDEALDTVERVRGQEFWHTAQVGEHSVEAPFMVATGPRQLMSGVIDLIHREPAGWMITDYKTDADGSSKLAGAYKMQLERYKQALTACGLPVAGATLTPVRRP